MEGFVEQVLRLGDPVLQIQLLGKGGSSEPGMLRLGVDRVLHELKCPAAQPRCVGDVELAGPEKQYPYATVWGPVVLPWWGPT